VTLIIGRNGMADDRELEPITKEEALAFLEAWRMMFANKVGFKQLTADLTRVADYIRRTDEAGG